MSLPHSKANIPRVTVDEYLRLERAAESRHEYLDGVIRAMAGESGAHGDISTNLVVLLGTQLKGKPCRARTKDTKVRSGPDRPHGSNTKGLFSYPDVVVICGEPVYHDEHQDVVLNPTVIVEVLSPSTEAFDRGEKFTRLQNWNPMLQDYVLVSQDWPQIEVYHRVDASTWTYKILSRLSDVAVLASIDCRLPLVDVFDRVTFLPRDGVDPSP